MMELAQQEEAAGLPEVVGNLQSAMAKTRKTVARQVEDVRERTAAAFHRTQSMCLAKRRERLMFDSKR
jgi:hypothetical protein